MILAECLKMLVRNEFEMVRKSYVDHRRLRHSRVCSSLSRTQFGLVEVEDSQVPRPTLRFQVSRGT